jgi:predicted CXXCH cytochrome family protein
VHKDALLENGLGIMFRVSLIRFRCNPNLIENLKAGHYVPKLTGGKKMKKIFVLLAVMVLISSSAFAVISGTKHDLSTDNTTGSDEICVFCHTPHGGGTDAPLWNRTSVSATAMYTSNSFNGGVASNTMGDSKLCLSCHSGTAIASALLNPANAGQANPTGTLTIGTAANIGVDLSNDHPVGFLYTASDLNDTEVYPIATVDVNGADLLFGTGDNEMWCSSCHDVHSNANTPFLTVSNGASVLCLTCHIK